MSHKEAQKARKLNFLLLIVAIVIRSKCTASGGIPGNWRVQA